MELENKTSKKLKVIGVLTIIFGIIGSLICGAAFPSITYEYSYYRGYDIQETYNWGLVLICAISSFISGLCFIGFSEIIALLQKNVNHQQMMIGRLQSIINHQQIIIQDMKSYNANENRMQKSNESLANLNLASFTNANLGAEW